MRSCLLGKLDLASGLKFLASSAGLVAFCLCADQVVFKWKASWESLGPRGVALRAVADSVTHGLVGGWCWVNVVLLQGEQFTAVRALQVAGCVVMATALDVDHFISARSLSLKDALNLPNRPFAHNTTVILSGAALLYLLFYCCPNLGAPPTRDLPLMFLLSTFSHHLRDADRRGIWLGPLLSTPPIPYKLYPFLIALLPALLPLSRLLPVCVRALLRLFHTKERTGTVLSV